MVSNISIYLVTETIIYNIEIILVYGLECCANYEGKSQLSALISLAVSLISGSQNIARRQLIPKHHHATTEPSVAPASAAGLHPRHCLLLLHRSLCL